MFEDTFNTYKILTNLDIESYFNDFKNFVNTDYPILLDYYSNKDVDIDKGVLDRLDDLIKESKKHQEAFSQFKNSFNTLQYWDLIDKLDTSVGKLETIANTKKWAKGNKGVGYSNRLTQDYILPQGKTFEKLSLDSGDIQKEDNWVQNALDNDINEEKYTPEGGVLLKIKFDNSQNFEVNTVAGSISGEDIYGIDYQKKLEFENEDLKALGYKETIEQSIITKLNLLKGSNPEYISDGVNKSLVGVSRNAFQYGTIFKDISKLFSRDGRFKSISLRDVKRDQDSQYFMFDIETRLGEVIEQTLAV